MAAPEGFQPGTFRGVAFVTERNAAGGGRRGVLHEFPQAEQPVWEDLGRKGARFSIDCHVRGSDFIAQANRLQDALDQPGVGTLVHPWRGSMQVAVEDYRRTDDTELGGITSFSIDFVESGLPAVPAPTADTQTLSTDAADAAIEEAQPQFEQSFDVAGATAFVEAAATTLVGGLATVATLEAALSAGAGASLRTFQQLAGALGAPAIVRDASQLGLATIGLVQAVSILVPDPGRRIDALTRLIDWTGDQPAVIGGTPARARQRDNQGAYLQLVSTTAAAEIVRATAAIDFASYDDAVALQDRVSARFDALALACADLGDDDGADLFDDLRRVLVRDIGARGGSLAKLQSYTPSITEPALVIAMRLYGDPAAVERQAQALVDRNRIEHPGFVPGGQALQVDVPQGSTDG